MKLKTDYSKIMVDNKFFKTIIVENFHQKDYGEQGCIFLPYIMGNSSEESLNERNAFMEEYNKGHECCPQCRDKGHTCTFMGYVLNMDEKEKYKDLNICICTNCGDKHTVDDRVPSL